MRDRELELVKDVFFCATHWGRARRIVRGALQRLLEQKLDVSTFVFAAAEYWRWAHKLDAASRESARALLERAVQRIDEADDLTQENLRRMLATLPDQ
ncbi:MAG: hypothetical protein JNM17_26685 [Archangium sp.]|nr:hypothetical protein [Archangium sp.]